LLSRYRPSRQDIEQAVNTMPRQARERATENLVYLNTMSGNEIDL